MLSCQLSLAQFVIGKLNTLKLLKKLNHVFYKAIENGKAVSGDVIPYCPIYGPVKGPKPVLLENSPTTAMRLPAARVSVRDGGAGLESKSAFVVMVS